MLNGCRGTCCPPDRPRPVDRRRVLLATLVLAVSGGAAAAAPPALESWSPAPMPAADLPDLGGVGLPVAAMPGRVSIVHFFATWCDTCRDELDALDRLARGAAGPPVRVVAVSGGEPPIRVRRFFETRPVSFPVLLDEARAVMKAWDVSLFPSSFVFGADGAGRYRAEGDVAWVAPATLGLLAELSQ